MHAIFKDSCIKLCEFHIKLTINRTSTKREITVIGSLTPKYGPFFFIERATPTNPPTHPLLGTVGSHSKATGYP